MRIPDKTGHILSLFLASIDPQALQMICGYFLLYTACINR